VRAVGGLADTVADRDYCWDPAQQRTGYVFHHTDQQALESALGRTIGLWHDYPEEFRQLMLNGMQVDRSWARPAQDYLNIYHHISHK
jgi:starch synthase